MLVLSIESSAKPVSVAVYQVSESDNTGPDRSKNTGSSESDTTIEKNTQSCKLLGQYFQYTGFSHSRTLLTMTESLLKNLEIKLSDIGLIAVAKGPGSFTGVRIGVSAVKGLAWGLDIPVCGVSTLEAMVFQTLAKPGILVCPVMDARRSQVYNALFKWHEGKPVRLCEDRAISIEDLKVELRSYSAMPLMLVGDGINVCDESDLFSNFGELPEPIRYQTAYGVALAAIRHKPIPAVELEPFYLRPSQAERERKINKLKNYKRNG
ncbi:MAG: tRNA (adenosine(37)-N6)-threonylcarbamoyltransferase complex dimerization subunit type 1 TsaB [Oscillospiraceae bacterium]|nr:tRNA (adenosine(37)-N6)-threonylcarbamoyltransferase complex dimerization subunit type 1 TsaB [Oscillospiraceae bacterium]